MQIDPATEERIVGRVFEKLAAVLSARANSAACADPEFFNTAQVERQFGIKRATASSWVRAKKVRGIPGKPCLIHAADLRRFLLARCG
jgi:hypothetical protein